MTNNNLPKNWLKLFDQAYKQASKSDLLQPYPSAVRLATASKSGIPSLRMVLLKSYDQKGFVIYTNMNSKKGQQLTENPYAALYFYWPEIDKEIAIEGKVEMIADKESDDYFASRPFFSKIGAHASKQSQIMKCKIEFLARIAFFTVKFLFKKKIDRPSYWRGFRVVPEKIDFIR